MHGQHLLSLAFLTVQGCPPVEHVRAAAAAGYDAAGLRIMAPQGLDLAHPIVGNPRLIREIKSAGNDLGISFLDGEVFTLTPTTDVAGWQPVLDTAADLGMTIMQITCEDPDLSRAVDNCARVADAAAKYGIAIAIEFMRWRAAATIEDAARLATATGRDNVSILLDVLHLSRSGGSPESVRTLPPGLVSYVQLCDAPAPMPEDDTACIAEARSARMLPGDGDLPLRDLMASLPKDIAISVETPHQGDTALSFIDRARRGIEATRAFLDGLRAD